MSTIETMPMEAHSSQRPVAVLLRMVVRALWSAYAVRRQLQRSRVRLFELSDAELHDIGLTREIAEREASRSLLACYLNNSR